MNVKTSLIAIMVLLGSLLIKELFMPTFFASTSVNEKPVRNSQLGTKQEMVDNIQYDRAKVQKVVQAFEVALGKRTLVEQSSNGSNFSKISLEDGLAADEVLVGARLGGVFLQAPHRLSDRYTSDILKKLMLSMPVDAAFSNHLHRRIVDYSYQSNSILIDLSLAYLKHTSGGVVVQLHGFAQEKRTSSLARNANIIVSSGHKGALRLPSLFADCLQRKGFSEVNVFGRDVQELGATRNSVKNALYENRLNRFLHVELSLEQRLALKDSSELRNRFSECLMALVTKSS